MCHHHRWRRSQREQKTNANGQIGFDITGRSLDEWCDTSFVRTSNNFIPDIKGQNVVISEKRIYRFKVRIE